MREIDNDTRLALIEKAERFAVEFDDSYWKHKHPPEEQKFIHACVIIQELAGLVINLLEEGLECE